ncbi:stage II sporulation protein P [Cytobacillus gottheilii]|uniref:stage II sporulation protein P n=1 Tax=Cytobacillus gottheilii TaxID=859144 RepID=UPI000836DCBD|nr:stage II sporulation protein P [Cytobacillus gottheilii]
MRPQKSSGILITVQGSNLVKSAAAFLLFIFMIFSISGAITSLNPDLRPSSESVNKAASFFSADLLYKIIGTENRAFAANMDLEEGPNLSSLLFQLSTNINLDDPRSLLGRELPSFTIFDTEILVAGEGTNYTNMPIESAPPQDVFEGKSEPPLQNVDDLDEGEPGEDTAPPPQSTDGKEVVYVYFTHNTESFLPYLKGVTDPNKAFHSQINVTKIGDKLKEELEGKGIGTTIDKTDVQSRLVKKGWSYGQSYQESREVIASALGSNKDLTYLIDIHRDSRRKEQTTKVINGESYAQLAFVIGGKHQNYEKNNQLAQQLHKGLESKYPGLSRGVLLKDKSGSNGIYNQDLSENAILVEFGGVDNTFEELNRSAAALADVFSEFYWQAEEVNGSAQN